MKIQNDFYDEIRQKIDFLYKNSETAVLSHLQSIKNESIKIHDNQKEVVLELRRFVGVLLESEEKITQLNKQLDKRYELENEIIKIKKIIQRKEKKDHV